MLCGTTSIGAWPVHHTAVTLSAAAPGEFEAAVRPLWLRAVAGDEAAYRAALHLMAQRLRAWLRRRLQQQPDEVEDLLQETLLALHLQRASWDASVPVSAWALAIARHKLVDLWRRRGRRDDHHESLDDVDEQLLATRADEGPVQRDLEQLLRQLPPAQRDAIVLTKVEGLSVAEAAGRTGASESAIKVQVHRGLKKLAQLVKRWRPTTGSICWPATPGRRPPGPRCAAWCRRLRWAPPPPWRWR